MKKILLLLVALLILFSIFLFYSNNNPRITIYHLLKKGDIKSGELIYRVNLFGIIPLSEAIFRSERIEKYDGREVYHLSASAEPLKLYSGLFKGYGIVDSYVDTQTFDPILFRQKTAIPDKGIIDKEVLYDQQNGIMTLAGVKRVILPDTQDPLSLIFNIRHMNFDNIKNLEMNINTNQKNYIFQGTVSQKDILINNQTHKIIVIKAEIKRRDKNPYHRSTLTIVLLKNKNENIPILIKAFASGFLINAKLIDIK